MFAVLRTVLSRFAGLFGAARFDGEVDDEVRAHLALLAERFARQGMTPEEARYAALRQFGGITPLKERLRERQRWPQIETTWQDVRYGFRMLAKTPALTVMVVFTLGLGIGANSAIFSVVNAFLLRPLPVKDPQQIVVLANSEERNPDPHDLSYLDYQDYRVHCDAFTDISGFIMGFAGLSSEGRSDRILVSYVPGNYFSMLGLEPQHGRLILPGEGEKPGADPVIVLGYSFWKRRFLADPSVIGKSVYLNARSYTIVGVAAKNFRGTFAIADMDAYLPLGMAAVNPERKDLFTNRGNRSFCTLGRLKPGVSLRQAEASLQVIAYAFDLLWLDGQDLRARPLIERKRLLRSIMPKQPSVLLYASHIERNGVESFRLTLTTADFE